MNKGRSSLSRGKSYRDIANFWDTHPLSDFWDKTKKVDFEVDIESEATYYVLDKRLSEKIRAIAQKRGISADTLVNLWIQEKIREQKA